MEGKQLSWCAGPEGRERDYSEALKPENVLSYIHEACIVYDLQCWGPNPRPRLHAICILTPTLFHLCLSPVARLSAPSHQLNAFIPRTLWKTAALWALAPAEPLASRPLESSEALVSVFEMKVPHVQLI